ncbi:hypothetical protein AB0C21_28960 [Spirillospora sp. NPDC049024]
MAALFSVLFLLVGWMLGYTELSDNSFMVHLATGHWILDHWVPREDIYSYTGQGVPWVAQSWLAEAVYALLDRTVGPAGIQVLDMAVGGLIALLAYRLAYRLQRDRGASAFLVVAALAPAVWLWVERPLLPGILAMLALVWLVEIPDSRAGRRPLLFLPPLMWSWENVHGSFMLGFGYLLLHLAGRWLDGHPPWRERELRLARAAALALAACLVNPYGTALVLFPFRLLGRGEILGQLVEWSSPDFHTPLGFVLAVWTVLVVGVLGLARTRPSRADVLVLAFATLISLWSMRNIALTPLIGLPVVARMLRKEARPDERTRINLAIAVLGVLAASQWTVAHLSRPSYNTDTYPVAAMRQMRDKGLLGSRLFTTDEWAGYVIHAYWPTQKVFLDDRYDMYPKSVVIDYLQARQQPERWRYLADRYRIEVVVWPSGQVLAQMLRADPEWRLVYGDGKAVVFARR